MESSIDKEFNAEMKVRELPLLVCVGPNIVFVDTSECGCCVFGPEIGKSFGDGEIEWRIQPLYEGKVTLSND